MFHSNHNHPNHGHSSSSTCSSTYTSPSGFVSVCTRPRHHAGPHCSHSDHDIPTIEWPSSTSTSASPPDSSPPLNLCPHCSSSFSTPDPSNPSHYTCDTCHFLFTAPPLPAMDIYKYQLNTARITRIPDCNRILYIGVQHDFATAWFEHLPGAPTKEIIPVTTGSTIPENHTHLGTVLLQDGSLVLHYYLNNPPTPKL